MIPMIGLFPKHHNLAQHVFHEQKALGQVLKKRAGLVHHGYYGLKDL